MAKHLREGKNYKKGDILISEEPFAFVLQSKLHQKRCDHCFKRTEVLKCTGCYFVHYCSRSCQKIGWSIHKYECHNMKRVLPRIVPDAVRMLGKIIIKMNNGEANKKSFYSETKFRSFKDLMSHYGDIKNDEKRIEHFTTLNAVLQEYLPDQLLPNSTELLIIYGKMVINTFNILDDEMQSIGSGLYLAASVIDHSCSPNAVAVFEGTTIQIRTLQNIEKLDWLNVNICYIELLNLPSIRQKELHSQYYFLCQCSKCKDINELKLMTATLCQNKKCNKEILNETEKIDAVCPHCNETITEETKDKVREIIEFSKNQLEKMGDLAYLDICKLCLEKQKPYLHPMNIYKVKILDLAMESCIDLKNWEGAFEYGTQLLKPFKVYYGDQHPLRGVFLMKLGKIALLINHINEAKQYFAEAATILQMTHGRTHSLIKELNECIHQCTLGLQTS